MKIGTIGAGEMGGRLALKWSEAGHQVRVANTRGGGAVTALAQEKLRRRSPERALPRLLWSEHRG